MGEAADGATMRASCGRFAEDRCPAQVLEGISKSLGGREGVLVDQYVEIGFDEAAPRSIGGRPHLEPPVAGSHIERVEMHRRSRKEVAGEVGR